MADKAVQGLADVVAASTALSDIDGQAGRLFLPRVRHPPARRGGDLRRKSPTCCNEDRRRTRVELDGFRAEIAAGRTLGKLVNSCLAEISGGQEPMEAMRTLVSLASADDPDKDSNSPEANTRKAARLTAQQPILVAAYDAARRGIQSPARRSRAGSRGQLPASECAERRHLPARRRSWIPAW